MTFVRRFGIAIIGAVAVLLGVWEFVWSMVLEAPHPFGWTAYAPLSHQTFQPSPVAFPLAIVLICSGFCVVASAVGAVVGRRLVDSGAIRRFLFLGIGAVGLAAVFGAALVFGSHNVSFGWIGYSDDSTIQFDPPQIIWGDVIGILVASALFGCIFWWVGETVGRRSAGGRARTVTRPSEA